MTDANWIDANQRVLVAEFARLRAQIGGDAPDAMHELARARASLPAPAAIDVLSDAFGLTSFERDLLLLCAGVEMHGALAALCAQRNELPRAAHATFGFALAHLAEQHWSALTPVGPLRRWRLVDVLDVRALASSRLCIDERILHFLAGIDYLDARLWPLISTFETTGLLAEGQVAAVAAARAAFVEGTGRPLVVQLVGDDVAGSREVAGAVARSLGREVYLLSADDIPTDPHEREALQLLCSREARLANALFLVEFAATPTRVSLDFVQSFDGFAFTGAATPLPLKADDTRLVVERPAAHEQKGLWMRALGADAGSLNGSLDVLASQFRVGTDVMARVARNLRASHSDPHGALRSCRDAARDRLADLAQRLAPVATWSDLVLPDTHITTLRQIAVHVRQQIKVYEEWGFGRLSVRGLGVSVLFSGESGTGKTLAADVLANDLHLDLYRVDLASLVSKYIGETEKNLRRVFDAAEDSGAILLFDEADALFGKRGEVNNSHDRYANIEVSYLLQRMEAYRGLAILTTNLRDALDSAFHRRLRFMVHFPFPDCSLRERIWRCAFPVATPVGPIDHQKLARLNVTGGNIRNIALNAAFLAAEQGQPVHMRHLLSAARQEATKRGLPLSDAETRGWA